VQLRLSKAMAWEKAFIEFMQNFTADPSNLEHLDIAFNSQRSIEDELEKETSGDVLTIAVSYLIMFFYITFSLGQVTKVSRFMVSDRWLRKDEK
jgi:Niemann-Pick C1 protein